MAKTTSNYEVMYIIDTAKSEDELKAIVEKFRALIEANGTIIAAEEIGKRRLAYLINDKAEGYYVLVKFTSGSEFPAELQRVLGITDGIMRSLVTVSGN